MKIKLYELSIFILGLYMVFLFTYNMSKFLDTSNIVYILHEILVIFGIYLVFLFKESVDNIEQVWYNRVKEGNSMELNYDNLNETREFLINELKCFESYLKYLKDRERNQIILAM